MNKIILILIAMMVLTGCVLNEYEKMHATDFCGDLCRDKGLRLHTYGYTEDTVQCYCKTSFYSLEEILDYGEYHEMD